MEGSPNLTGFERITFLCLQTMIQRKGKSSKEAVGINQARAGSCWARTSSQDMGSPDIMLSYLPEMQPIEARCKVTHTSKRHMLLFMNKGHVLVEGVCTGCVGVSASENSRREAGSTFASGPLFIGMNFIYNCTDSE